MEFVEFIKNEPESTSSGGSDDDGGGCVNFDSAIIHDVLLSSDDGWKNEICNDYSPGVNITDMNNYGGVEEDISSLKESTSNVSESPTPTADPPRGKDRRRRRRSSMVSEDSDQLRRRLDTNERERLRMHDLNATFDDLRQVLPPRMRNINRRLTKKETLKLAIKYIKSLTNIT